VCDQAPVIWNVIFNAGSLAQSIDVLSINKEDLNRKPTSTDFLCFIIVMTCLQNHEDANLSKFTQDPLGTLIEQVETNHPQGHKLGSKEIIVRGNQHDKSRAG
jgi:hypothetical protein